MSESMILAIDSGGSKSDFVLLRPDGQVVARSHGKGVAALYAGMLPVENFLRAGQQGLEQYVSRIVYVYCSLGGPNTEEVQMALCHIFPQAEVHVGREANGNMVLSAAAKYHANAAVLCGTGSTAVGQIGGSRVYAGGWGPTLGDGGSGGGLGYDALRMLLQAIDRGEGPIFLPGIYPSLERCPVSFEERMAVKMAANNISRAEMAAQVPVIVELAENGDNNAMNLLKKAASEIAFLAKSITPEIPDNPEMSGILALGGFFNCGTLFRDLCCTELQKTRKNHHYIFDAVSMIEATAAFAVESYNRSMKK